MLDIAQKTTVDKSRLMCKYGAAGLTLSLFVPFIGPVLAGAALLLGALNVRDKSKNFTTKEEAEIGLLKTLEHYGLIRLLSNDQIELVS